MTFYFGLMFGCHVRQCFTNITTNEMENAWRYSYLQQTRETTRSGQNGAAVAMNRREFANPFDRGMAVNCTDSFFRPCFLRFSGRGRLYGSDGHIKACPSDTFPDYYRIHDVEELKDTRVPSYTELVSIRQSGSHHKYDPVKKEEDDAV
eukprot:CAMPEP_0184313810 /NCGR_PEP_ID=MMETSP1049-20130417/67931_1 /TAXON_ID=77928 /ORGANISM="Proteomonas sulcata, Strain CCMP704" /LENGTH=148 /DNA_ID=CAMNT_0026631337 /DNA_START=124 /DNA_END=570 /DNA_ORIENTATION=-